MNKLIKLLSVVVLTTTTSSSIIACSGNSVAKNDLSSVTALTGLNLNFNSANNFSALNSQIVMAREFNKPLVNYKIKWLGAETGGNDISDKVQSVRQVWVEIIVNGTDANWVGSTNLISVSVTKNDLAKLTTLTDLNLIVVGTKDFSALNSQLKNATEFANSPLNNYLVKWFGAATRGQDISNTKQTTGKVWVEITINPTDSNWQGTTSLIGINVGKNDLANITTLTGLNIVLNGSQKFSDLNSQLKSATEFVNNPLNDYTVKWIKDSDIDVSNWSQIAGQVWVEITADDADNNWTGTTSRIQLVINKNDLAKLTTLTGLNLSADITKKFSVLNSMLSTANEFKGNYFRDYTVKWFDAETGGIDISDQLQIAKKVWVEITADEDKNWQGTTRRLSIYINAANFNIIAGTTGAISAMATDSSNNTIYVAGKTANNAGKVYKSNGTDGFVAIGGIAEPIIKMATNNSNGKVYAISSTQVYVSTSGIADFTKMAGISVTLNSIAVAKDGTVYVGTNKGVYKSDGTSNFTLIRNNNENILNVAVFNNTLYLATREKVYKLTGPDTFTEIPGITEQIVNLSIDTNSGEVYITTFQRHANIWKSNGTDGFTKFLDLKTTPGQITICSFDSANNTFYYSIERGSPMTNRLFKIKDTETVATEISSGITDRMNNIAILNDKLYVGTSTLEFTGNVYKKN